jgi:hypothetical protein
MAAMRKMMFENNEIVDELILDSDSDVPISGDEMLAHVSDSDKDEMDMDTHNTQWTDADNLNLVYL